ncbi:MAG TPA: response regulator transcription factor [Thermoleophilaceae bacterium]|nr:response regulator transcription factor [Thermoleophilaceae bacterium]
MPTVVSARFEDLVALALRVLISEDPNLDLVESDVSVDTLEQAIERHHPKVAVLNFGTLRSPAQVFELNRAHPETRLVVLANRPSPADCNQMLSFGATACLSKETEARDVISAIHLAARGLHVLPQSSGVHGGDPVRIVGVDQLTPREGEVLEQLQEGATNAEIAERLAIGVETVRTHARKIYRKLGIASRRELARLERQGLVTLEQR